MPANTAKGFPYPLPTDPLTNGATAIKNLATAVDTRLGVLASGTVSVNVTTGGTPATVTVTFPVGRFTVAPTVVAGPLSSAANSNVQAAAAAATLTSVVISAVRATAGPQPVQWIASQV